MSSPEERLLVGVIKQAVWDLHSHDQELADEARDWLVANTRMTLALMSADEFAQQAAMVRKWHSSRRCCGLHLRDTTREEID